MSWGSERMVIGIDPGPEQVGYCLFDGERPGECGIMPVVQFIANCRHAWPLECAIIEKIECYGMAVGAEVFATCYVVGRLQETFHIRGLPFVMMPRRTVKSHICHSAKATDANIRQALIDHYGGKGAAIGDKRNPGPLYRVKSHSWAALALAFTYCGQRAAIAV